METSPFLITALLGCLIGAASALIGTRAQRGGAQDARLHKRVSELEDAVGKLPAYRAEMAALADECEELLERAEKKRRSAAGARAQAKQAEEAGQELGATDRRSQLRRIAGLGREGVR